MRAARGTGSITTFRGDAMMAADGPRPKPWRCGGGVGALDARGLSSGGSITDRMASSNGIESAAANSAGDDGSSVELGGVIRDHDGRGSAASSSSVGSSAPPNKRFQKGDGGGVQAPPTAVRERRVGARVVAEAELARL